MTRQFFVYGLVQGVGFRYFTWKQACKIGLKGTVKNRPDGSVEVIAQGTEQQINALYQWLQQGPASAQVEFVQQQPYNAPDFKDFAIIH